MLTAQQVANYHILRNSNLFSPVLEYIYESESGIDVALTRRYDVLTKMLDTVKGYQKYEQSVLSELIKLRSELKSMKL